MQIIYEVKYPTYYKKKRYAFHFFNKTFLGQVKGRIISKMFHSAFFFISARRCHIEMQKCTLILKCYWRHRWIMSPNLIFSPKLKYFPEYHLPCNLFILYLQFKYHNASLYLGLFISSRKRYRTFLNSKFAFMKNRRVFNLVRFFFSWNSLSTLLNNLIWLILLF